jgi:hypothetical protein
MGNALNFIKEDLSPMFAEDMIEAMQDIIKQDGVSSRYPQSGRLANSLSYTIDGNGDIKITANAPYAKVQMQNGITQIRPRAARRLRFFWYRIGKQVRAKSVVITGKNLVNRGAEIAGIKLEKHVSRRLREMAHDIERDSRGRFLKRRNKP